MYDQINPAQTFRERQLALLEEKPTIGASLGGWTWEEARIGRGAGWWPYWRRWW
jgi:hypothetical protein